MISEKITYLLKNLDVENSIIAGYAGCSPANFCRLKSGSRNYSENSTTVRKFADGVYSYCRDNGKTDELCRILGIQQEEEHPLNELLLNWLFEENSLPEDSIETDSAKQFGKKLAALMQLARLSNSNLSKMLGIDASYVSRMRSGLRIPRKSTGLMMRLSAVLAEQIASRDKLRDLIDIMGTQLKSGNVAESIFVWLYARGMPANVQAVRNFIEQMKNMPSTDVSLIPLPVIPEIPNEDYYTGDKGLQQAVVRFLSSVINNHSSELRLYSDNGINWMTGDFKALWSGLMAACLRNGTRIKIIHNVDRSVSEMIQAIISWLPLYMTGLVEPYYSTRPAGERFTCTIFLDPESACVGSFGVRDMADDEEYSYITSPQKLEKTCRYFDALLARCRPLVTVDTVSEPQADAEVYSIGNVQLVISENSVTVNKLDAPQKAFTFTYAPMCRAFRSFADSIEDNT